MWPHKKGGINNNQHSYTCAVRCKVLFVQTGGQFKAHSRTCFPMKPSLVFYPFSSKYYHIWPLDLWREALPISSTARFTEARLPEAHLSNAPSNVGSPNFPGQLLHLSEPASALLEPASESTGAGRRLLRHMQHDSSFKFNHMGWRSISELWPLLLNQPTKPAVGQKATCPGVSPALQADVTF